jgi:diacylglycerol kinase family enzyme
MRSEESAASVARVFLIVNTNATRHSPRRQRHVQDVLGMAHKLETAVTTHKGHATDLAREAVNEGFEIVVTLGGDGTINEALNGLAHSDSALGILPGGHTNVLARTLGIPRQLDRAVAQLMRDIGRRRRRSLGLGKLDGRYFAFVAGFGFDAEVVEAVERRVDLKKIYRDWFFVSQAIRVFLFHFDRENPAITLSTAERSEDGIFFALVLNSSIYTYLKSFPIRPASEASFERALWAIAPKTSKVRKVLALLGSAMVSGNRIRPGPDLAVFEDEERISLDAKTPVAVQVDGEFIGRISSARLGWEPDVVEVVC